MKEEVWDEADSLIQSHGAAGSAEAIESLADSIGMCLTAYDPGLIFGQEVIAALRTRARELRPEDRRAEIEISATSRPH